MRFMSCYHSVQLSILTDLWRLVGFTFKAISSNIVLLDSCRQIHYSYPIQKASPICANDLKM